MKTRVQTLREAKNLTQSELAVMSGLSLRTIQRIEAGSIPKGFTLRSLAETLEIEPENLTSQTPQTDVIHRAKLINISVLTSLIIPFGNIIFPWILIYRTKELKAKELGKKILSFQLIYTFILCTLMIVSPFIQKAFSIKIPLFIIFLVVLKSFNIFITFKNGSSLTQKGELYISLKNSVL